MKRQAAEEIGVEEMAMEYVDLLGPEQRRKPPGRQHVEFALDVKREQFDATPLQLCSENRIRGAQAADLASVSVRIEPFCQLAHHPLRTAWPEFSDELQNVHSRGHDQLA